MTLLRERERSDDNDARAFLLSNTVEERIESLDINSRFASNSASSVVDYAQFRSRSHAAVIRVYDEAGNLDLSGWEERIRKSKRQPKLPGRHQETVRFFNAVKKGSASGRMTMTLALFF